MLVVQGVGYCAQIARRAGGGVMRMMRGRAVTVPARSVEGELALARGALSLADEILADVHSADGLLLVAAGLAAAATAHATIAAAQAGVAMAAFGEAWAHPPMLAGQGATAEDAGPIGCWPPVDPGDAAAAAALGARAKPAPVAEVEPGLSEMSRQQGSAGRTPAKTAPRKAQGKQQPRRR